MGAGQVVQINNSSPDISTVPWFIVHGLALIYLKKMQEGQHTRAVLKGAVDIS